MSTEDRRENLNPQVEEEEISEEALSEQRRIRREKLKALQEAGRNPFLEENWNVTAHSKDIKDNFEAMEVFCLHTFPRLFFDLKTELLFLF